MKRVLVFVLFGLFFSFCAGGSVRHANNKADTKPANSATKEQPSSTDKSEDSTAIEYSILNKLKKAIYKLKNRVIAIDSFTDVKGNDVDEGKLLCERLVSALANMEGVSVVERSKLEKIVEEQKKGVSGIIDSDTAVRIGKLLGAKAMLYGSIAYTKQGIEINARLVDVEKGTIIGAAKVIDKGGSLSLEAGEKIYSEKIDEKYVKKVNIGKISDQDIKDIPLPEIIEKELNEPEIKNKIKRLLYIKINNPRLFRFIIAPPEKRDRFISSINEDRLEKIMPLIEFVDDIRKNESQLFRFIAKPPFFIEIKKRLNILKREKPRLYHRVRAFISDLIIIMKNEKQMFADIIGGPRRWRFLRNNAPDRFNAIKPYIKGLRFIKEKAPDIFRIIVDFAKFQRR